MNYYPYNSREKIYKENRGAMASGESFAPRLLLHNDADVRDAYLCIQKDKENPMEYKMAQNGSLEDYKIYEISLPLDTGIYWYYFRYESAHGEFFVVRENVSRGVVSKEKGLCWQQTVYEPTDSLPDWLFGGIIYQIFPDRFYKAEGDKNPAFEDRCYRDDWGGVPYYEQNGTVYSLGNDYFGGNFAGIKEKLPYIKSLGVTCIYLNPIFEAHSNHRYNTADYFKCDPVLGDKKEFSDLCMAAKKLGIHIILDGVFSHTGDDSIYFNKYKRYGEGGAYNSEHSPYYSWFKFKGNREIYDSWWGVKTLPEVNEENPDYINFICGKEGVLQHWMKAGADGWRLDVADELPDVFLDSLRNTVKAVNKNAFILGEVWENATNKISYGNRRRYLLGKQLDSVMNYPFADGIINYIRTANADALLDTVTEICEQYPPDALNLLMNHLGTHDTARILTRLSRNSDDLGSREAQADLKITDDELKLAKRRLKAAAVIQYTLPGIPSVYYGDEAGLCGAADPFCRGCYPWGKEDKDLLIFYKNLGALRGFVSAFLRGEFEPYRVEDGLFAFYRNGSKNSALIAVNAGQASKELELPKGYRSVFGKDSENGKVALLEHEYLIAVKEN